ncbi:MAG: hypothetical protein K6T75_11605 [Acetobacteraceae bacterium]|nr:hypothetical protein [Acetobacteraceae bacterium]
MKAGLKWFPRSAVVLDRFHLKRQLVWRLWGGTRRFTSRCAP